MSMSPPEHAGKSEGLSRRPGSEILKRFMRTGHYDCARALALRPPPVEELPWPSSTAAGKPIASLTCTRSTAAWKRITSLTVFLLATAACGYRFTAGGAPLPEGIRQVYAPVFINRTGSNPINRLGETYRAADEPGVEVVCTQAFREQLVRAGVAGDNNSAAQVIGEVLSVGGGPTILTPAGGLASYRVSMSVRLRLVKNGREVARADVSGTEDYLPGRDFLPQDRTTPREGDVLKSEANRMAAIRRLADSLMREAYDRLSTGW